jgi:hypothetical protein
MAGYIILAIFAALVIGVLFFLNRIFGPRVDKFVNSLPLRKQFALGLAVLGVLVVLWLLVGR